MEVGERVVSGRRLRLLVPKAVLDDRRIGESFLLSFFVPAFDAFVFLSSSLQASFRRARVSSSWALASCEFHPSSGSQKAKLHVRHAGQRLAFTLFVRLLAPVGLARRFRAGRGY